MKKTLLWLLVTLASTAPLLAQEQLDFNLSSIPEVKSLQQEKEVSSGHSISISLIGLEYNYECALGNDWSLLMRAGLSTAPVRCGSGVESNNFYATLTFSTDYFPSLAVTLEPRYYYNMQKRVLANKKTINNSANFFSLQTKVYNATTWDETARIELSLIPTFGIRRAGKHWYQEYTFGLGLHTRAVGYLPIPILLHLGIRIGYEF